ncbi:MAG TPA: methyltransferase domain-containing protein [Saprospiraceae bacterium]|nr:methyltransferase domain-containing protein [Saprospiraceae bacterium]
MKVGTDAVLLGAWTQVDFYPDTILDIGAGTGVISLMMAQRSDAQTIDAVEIAENAYEQAVENFEQSDWADRLFCYHTSFNDFVDEMKDENEKYDLIVSNPPFYADDFISEDLARNTARFTTSLPFENLITGASALLSDDGVFSVIIPYKEETNFITMAQKNKLLLQRVCRVKGTPKSPIKRSLLTFSFHQKVCVDEEIIIETARHQYTVEYINLTKDFYLKM